MPIYEFECTNDRCEANLRYEKELKINEPHDVECGFCHEPMRKIYSSFGISFKGSGFYKTDSAKSTTSPTPAPTPKAD